MNEKNLETSDDAEPIVLSSITTESRDPELRKLHAIYKNAQKIVPLTQIEGVLVVLRELNKRPSMFVGTGDVLLVETYLHGIAEGFTICGYSVSHSPPDAVTRRRGDAVGGYKPTV